MFLNVDMKKSCVFDANNDGFSSFEKETLSTTKANFQRQGLHTLLICIPAESLQPIHGFMHMNHTCVPKSLPY